MITRSLEPAVTRARLRPSLVGMVLFLLTEIMFFAGLLAALSVLRVQGAGGWPPAGQPRLPVAVTSLNTMFLLLSGGMLLQSFRKPRRAKFLVRGALVLGAVFLAVQGYEWIRMLHYGLTVSSGVYGGFFYALVGSHALHALAGLIVLGGVDHKLSAPGASGDIGDYRVPALYWFFVVLIWPVIFLSIYIQP